MKMLVHVCMYMHVEVGSWPGFLNLLTEVGCLACPGDLICLCLLSAEIIGSLHAWLFHRFGDSEPMLMESLYPLSLSPYPFCFSFILFIITIIIFSSISIS